MRSSGGRQAPTFAVVAMVGVDKHVGTDVLVVVAVSVGAVAAGAVVRAW